MLIFDLLATAFSAVFYGIIATAAMMTFLYVILRTLNAGAVRSLMFYATGVILSLLLAIQFSLLVGAVNAKSTVDSAELFIRQMTENAYGTVSAVESQQVLDNLTEEFPLVGVYIDVCDFSGNDVSSLAAVMGETMRDYLTSYIWHRVWWILGFSVVACVIALVFRKKETVYTMDLDALV